MINKSLDFSTSPAARIVSPPSPFFSLFLPSQGSERQSPQRPTQARNQRGHTGGLRNGFRDLNLPVSNPSHTLFSALAPPTHSQGDVVFASHKSASLYPLSFLQPQVSLNRGIPSENMTPRGGCVMHHTPIQICMGGEKCVHACVCVRA